MRRELKRLRTYLGRLFRDISRKIAGKDELEARFARLLGLIERLLAQKPKDSNKLYSLHAPEVVCISKGKARTPYEFGCKVGIATTNREGLVLAAKSFEGSPYDGHTLAATVDQAVEIGGVETRSGDAGSPKPSALSRRMSWPISVRAIGVLKIWTSQNRQAECRSA